MSENKIIPKCKTGDTSYFSSEGRWLPCCSFPHLGKRLSESIFSRDDFLIENNIEFDKFHEKEIFKIWIDHIEDNYENSLPLCKNRCSNLSHEIQKNNKDVTWVMDDKITIKSIKDLHEFLENENIDYDFDELVNET
jgi:hypothetical protein